MLSAASTFFSWLKILHKDLGQYSNIHYYSAEYLPMDWIIMYIRHQQTARWCNRDIGENVNEVRASFQPYRTIHIKMVYWCFTISTNKVLKAWNQISGFEKIFPFFLTTYTRVGTLIVATIYLQLIQNRYMFRSFTVLQCSHQHCLRPVASDVEVLGYL